MSFVFNSCGLVGQVVYSALGELGLDKTVRCHEHGLAYDPAATQGCVLCRRSIRAPRRSGILVIVWSGSLLALLTGILVIWSTMPSGGTHSTVPKTQTDEAVQKSEALPPDGPGQTGADIDEQQGQLQKRNSAGRSGSFYLPPQSSGGRAPILVAIHATGSNGRAILGQFQALAKARGFAIIGPDSRVSPDGQFTWEVSDQPGELTPDFLHIHACLLEVVERFGARLDLERVLILGHSGGASSAPYVATNTEPFTSFAVLHGGAFARGFGKRAVRGWFSTGLSDKLRPPNLVREAASQASAGGLGEVVYREFAGGHGLGSTEKTEVVNWWLGTK